MRHLPQGLGERARVNLLPERQNSTNWLISNLPKSSAHASGGWCHSHPPVTIPIWDFNFDISEWHILLAREWTPALMLHLTNPYAKRKVLSLTKPKGKIYKTKSLGHYITGEAKTKTLMTFSYWPLHIDMPVLDDQQEFIYNSSVRTKDEFWMTCLAL